MTALAGTFGSVWIPGTPLAPIGQIRTWSLTTTADNYDASVLGECAPDVFRHPLAQPFRDTPQPTLNVYLAELDGLGLSPACVAAVRLVLCSVHYPRCIPNTKRISCLCSTECDLPRTVCGHDVFERLHGPRSAVVSRSDNAQE